MRARFLAVSLAIAAMLATPASASAEVELRITAGRVWLKAVNATVGQILNEWARLGQTEIVNGDRVPGGPLTLQLDNVSEEEALDVLLKSAAGFMGVRRTTPVAANSEFDRILILPRSTAVATAAQPAGLAPSPAPPPTPVFAQQPPPSFTPGVQRVLDAQGQPVPDDQDDGPRPPQQQPPTPYSPQAPTGQPPAQPAGSQTPGVPVGVPVPGMTVPAPRPQPQNPPDGP